ncbi:MAG TPA: thioesterase domain-containing protein [Ktedonobacteraceae bacterium]|nr:thioesterase domain-containing protein [Ktedonobacteraceae bacterium]
MTRKANSWIQYWQRKPQARVRLFCFPYAGGGASVFRTWSECLSQDIEVCPVQLPGREERLSERPFSDLPSLLGALVPALLPYLDIPYAFFGHSMGTLISFELARYLRQMKYSRMPVHLFVSGHSAPQIPDPDPPTYQLPEPEFIEALRQLKGTPEGLLENAEFVQLLLPLLRADFALCDTYKYIHRKPLPIPISACGGLQDPEVTHDGISAWRMQTSGPEEAKNFRLRFFEGDHFFIHKEQAALLQALSQDLLESLGVNKAQPI